MIGDMLQGLIESVRAEERKNYVLRILAVIGAIAAIAAIAYGIYRFLTPDYFDDYDDDDISLKQADIKGSPAFCRTAVYFGMPES